MIGGALRLPAIPADAMNCLWQATWQGSVGLLVVWLICQLLPRMPARYQCWLWRLALAKFLVVFLWRVPVSLPLLPPVAEPAAQAETPIAALSADSSAEPVHAVSLPSASPVSTPPLAGLLPLLLTGLCAGWFVGAAWQGGHLVRGWLAVRQFRRSCRRVVDDDWARTLRSLCAVYGVRHPPLLLEHSAAGSPFLLGICRPAIILPIELRSALRIEERRMALAHELAHIKRQDLAWSLVAAVVRTAFLFHPLVWWAVRRMELAQEIAADQSVLTSFRQQRSAYAEMLLTVATQPHSNGLVPTLSAGTVGRYENLERRFVAMKSFNPASRRLVAVSAILVASIAISGVVPWRLVAADAPVPAAGNTGARSDLAELSPGQKKIIEALQQPTQVEFFERPLKDAIASMEKRHNIPIRLDAKALHEVGVPDDCPMTKCIQHTSLHSALRILLADLELMHVIRQEVLVITTPEEGQRLLRQGAIDPAAYWKSSETALTAKRKIAEALKKPVQVEFRGEPLWKAVPSLKKTCQVEIQFDAKNVEDAGVQFDAPVTLEAKGAPLESVLSQLVRSVGLTYVVEDDYILITVPQKDMMR